MSGSTAREVVKEAEALSSTTVEPADLSAWLIVSLVTVAGGVASSSWWWVVVVGGGWWWVVGGGWWMVVVVLVYGAVAV